QQARYALEPQRRAGAAAGDGRFADEIVPVEVRTRKGAVTVSADEHPRPGTTLDSLARLPPPFAAAGTVHAGNASGVTDGAAALVLASGEYAARRGLAPMARVVA